MPDFLFGYADIAGDAAAVAAALADVFEWCGGFGHLELEGTVARS